MRKNIAKLLLVIFTVSIINFSFASKAEALFGIGDITHDPLNYIVNGLQVAAQHLSVLSTGIPGTGAVAKGAVTAATQGCVISEKAWKVANSSDNLASGIAVIGGDAAQITRWSVKIATLTAINTCYDTVLTAVRAGGSVGAMTGSQALEALGMSELELTNIVLAYDGRIARLVELRDEAIKKMWEGVAYRVLATVQQQVTGRIINQLIAKYKIGNYLKYADAVATQIYTADYVRANFPDKSDQLIIRSILTSDAVNGGLMPYIKEKANENLGFLPQQLDFADPEYYQKMALAGTGSANPFYLRSIYEARAGMTKSEAEAQAKQEIAQGQGFIPARNCSGVIAQESVNLDKKITAANRDLAIKRAAWSKLNDQWTANPKSVADSELEKAAAAANESSQAYASMSKSPSLFAQVCADIKNPAAAISNFANSYLASSLNQVNAPRPGNLPFFASFVETVATNFLTTIVNGGTPSTEILTEAGFRGANIAADGILAGITETSALKSLYNSENGAIFSATPDSTVGFYRASWNATAVSGAHHVTITSGDIIYNGTTPSGQVSIRSTGGTTLILRVYDSNNKLLTTVTFTNPVVPAAELKLSPDKGSVREAGQAVGNAEGQLKNDGIIPPSAPPANSSSTQVIVPIAQNIQGQNVAGAFTETPYDSLRGQNLKTPAKKLR